MACSVMVTCGDDRPHLRAPFRRYVDIKPLEERGEVLDWCQFDTETEVVGITVSNLPNPILARMFRYSLQSFPLACGMILQEKIAGHAQSWQVEKSA